MKMLKIGLIILFSSGVHAFSANAINWTVDPNPVLDTDSFALGTGQNYIIRLIETASGGASSVIGFDSLTQQAGLGETVLVTYNWNSWMSVWDNGFFTSVEANANIGNVLSGDHLYTVIINSGTIGSASQYSILDAGGTPATVAVDGMGNVDYTLPGNNTWQAVAVPEPSTVGLLLVGVGLVALRRMRRT